MATPNTAPKIPPPAAPKPPAVNAATTGPDANSPSPPVATLPTAASPPTTKPSEPPAAAPIPAASGVFVFEVISNESLSILSDVIILKC
eukprot:CAMPEP_0182853244 /NCGR_PEP_ID=MMETSP0034_2-20130328/597_1 /TAXON_ID=156128 /ORGANISM="Nephroselmis pyriformis, Strain CCMP717" /LENGTH=88 /DNA_ID=CAMNT_0024984003 /DNA_START=542 /DNA_END=808 /DNA_ORIENTATION=-